jgi:hypothetical protein
LESTSTLWTAGRNLSGHGFAARRTEHSGPKRGCGAFYGPKAEAKEASDRRRRQDDKQAVLLNELKIPRRLEENVAI